MSVSDSFDSSEFFNRDVQAVAKDLLGSVLEHAGKVSNPGL